MRLREEEGIGKSAFIILYTAQFIPRKNHEMLIKNISSIRISIPNVHVLFVGNGPLWEECKQLSKDLGVYDCISFLGGRGDVERLCRLSDIHVATSKLEGQGINNIEAMACGCPLVVSRVRGHKDVCIDGKNGFLFDLNKPCDMIDKIVLLYQNKNLYKAISDYNKIDAMRFDVNREVEAMAKIYKEILGDKL